MRWIVLTLMVIGSLAVQAADTGSPEKNIRQSIELIAPDLEVTHIRPADVDGLYEVVLGTEVIYMSPDGRYVLRGELLDLENQTNMTQGVRSQMRQKLLADLPRDEMIRFSNGKSDHVIYVFTDIDCGYCRKLHQDVPSLMEQGVEVRYLAYPRAGLESDTYHEMESVWCSADRKSALTQAKQGKKIETKPCDNPVAAQYEIGRKMGIRGTPAIYLENGRSLPGYVPPKELLAILNGDS